MKTQQSAFEYGANKVHRTAIFKDKTANFNFPIPAGARLTAIHVIEKAGAAITGGLRVGSAAAGTQHVTAQAVAASSLYFVLPTVQAPVPQTAGTVYVEAVTAWNGAKVDMRFEYEELIDPTQVATVNGVQLYDPLGRH